MGLKFNFKLFPIMNNFDNSIYSVQVKVPASIHTDVNAMINKIDLKAPEIASNTSKESPRIDLWRGMWYEGEMCCLFSDTNLGKSILSVQIGNDLAERFHRDVLYFDFEQSIQQFAMRYSDSGGQYHLSDHLFRVDFQGLKEEFDMYDLLKYLEAMVVRHRSPFVIIDNITAVCENASSNRCVTDFFEEMKLLRRRYDLSVLVVAHTRRHSPNRPLCISDLSCSRVFGNFCDSIFAIGDAYYDRRLLYLKQLKSRSADFVADSDMVTAAHLVRIDHGVQFQFVEDMVHESRLIDRMSPERYCLYKSACNLSAEGNSLRNISKALGISKSTVQRLIQRYKIFTAIEQTGFNPEEDGDEDYKENYKEDYKEDSAKVSNGDAEENGTGKKHHLTTFESPNEMLNSYQEEPQAHDEKNWDTPENQVEQPSQLPYNQAELQGEIEPKVSHPETTNQPVSATPRPLTQVEIDLRRCYCGPDKEERFKDTSNCA